MITRSVGLSALAVALVVTAAACGPAADGAILVLSGSPASALTIVGSDLRGERGQIGSLVLDSARPGEHLEMIDGAYRSDNIVDLPGSPVAPSSPGPVPPKKLNPDPTQFQTDAHARQESAYKKEVADALQRLRAILGSRLRAWSAASVAALARLSPRDPETWDIPTGLRDAVGYFSSLQQAGVDVGSRRVIVVFWPAGGSGAVVPLESQSLSGTTVILVDFPGDQAAQAEWQADLLQAGASHAVVLVNGAMAELARVVSQALSGSQGPGLTDVGFGLNSALLGAQAQDTLAAVARQLLTTYRTAPVTVLGFADPLGSYQYNLMLSYQRALTVKNFLVAHGVAPGRLFAVGYGPGMPIAPSRADGAQPLDRRVVIVIDPTG